MKMSLHLEPLFPRAILDPTHEHCGSRSHGQLMIDQHFVVVVVARTTKNDALGKDLSAKIMF